MTQPTYEQRIAAQLGDLLLAVHRAETQRDAALARIAELEKCMPEPVKRPDEREYHAAFESRG
jgi:hypothetical protein